MPTDETGEAVQVPTWSCECLDSHCRHVWVDVFPETEDEVRCPCCNSDDIDAWRKS